MRGEGKRPGQIRDRAVLIGREGQSFDEARFVPPCHTQLGPLLGDFVDFLRGGRSLPVLVQAALMHYQFETIHPFNDGNGRVGRLLISLVLCERGTLPQPLLYLSAFFEQNRREYYDAMLAVSQRADWSNWLRYFATGVAEQARDAVVRIRKLLDLWREYRRRAVGAVRSPAALLIVDELFASPFVTMARAVEITALVYKNAQSIVEKLMAAGLLREITRKSRNRVYCADEILRLLDGPVTENGPA